MSKITDWLHDDRAHVLTAAPTYHATNYPTQASAPPIDPFVYASEVCAGQPRDKRWRRFQGLIFRVEDVRAVCNRLGDARGITLKLADRIAGVNHNFDLPFDCPDPSKWFAEHVLGMEFGPQPK